MKVCLRITPEQIQAHCSGNPLEETLSDLGAGVLTFPGLYCPSSRIKLYNEKVSIRRIGELEMFIRQPPEEDDSDS